MAGLTCPNCGREMERNEEADMATDECPECGAVFLDRGELNALATGMTGDIEYCSVDSDFHEDRFPARACPKCGSEMAKVNLLRLSDLIFDHCPDCGGFFLDKGEVAKMNRELRAMAPNKQAEEYRGTHGGRLVRVDRTGDIVARDYLGFVQTTAVSFIRVSVFFREEMPLGVRVFQERWPVRLAKGLGLFRGQDIETGDERFDSMFRVQGEDEAAVAGHLDAPAREALLSFAGGEHSICGKTGSLQVTSSAVVYVEGPYGPDSIDDVVGKSKPLIDELVDIADKIEAVP
ncbi:MAG: zf-TFIIB domain-containing protein [Planctomycetota bacterium]